MFKIVPFGRQISTSIPKGSEQRFLDFGGYLIARALPEIAQIGVWQDEYWGPSIRVSAGKHNIQRVEQVLKQLTINLQGLGYTESQVNDFFQHALRVEYRFNVQQLGPLIAKHDDIREADSFACSDGVIISPSSITGRVVVAPTIYEPSGEKIIPVTPGRVTEIVPQYQYTGFYTNSTRYISNPFLDFPKIVTGEYLKLQDAMENTILTLGRAATSYAKFVTALSGMNEDKLRYFDDKRYFRIAQAGFARMCSKVEAAIASASKLNVQTEEVQDRLQFYILLAQVYSTEVDFLISQHQSGVSMKDIIGLAQIFKGVGRDNVSGLPHIVEQFKATHRKPPGIIRRMFSR